MFRTGQRWISEPEPELGLGIVTCFVDHQVQVRFPGADAVRQYAADTAPLQRVQFQIGDEIESEDGIALYIDDVEEHDGLLIYHGNGQRLPEAELSHDLTFDQPLVRLQHQQFDTPHAFSLRDAALTRRHEIRRSPLRGFLGGRIDLIPHQFYIAHEVASRQAPRVLLADEVGLGKTIEAGMVLHRLLLNRRAERVLIVVPDSLVHQWFVEMLRRFNLWFHIFDQSRCEAIEASPESQNPFFDEQLVLAGLSLFTEHPRRAQQAADAGWDMLVVDEAHHLGWAPDSVSVEYQAIEQLSQSSPGLLLLTATPEQLGMVSHFARLRLLDPDRYYDLSAFLEEANDYERVAKAANRLSADATLEPEDQALLRVLLPERDDLEQVLAAVNRGDRESRRALLNDLIDRHGTGRVMMRNTRATIQGFPARHLHLHSLADDGPAAQQVALEFWHETQTSDNAPAYDYADDPRLLWLVDFLRQSEDKVLLICRTRQKVLALDESLRARLNVRAAVFHEDLTLVKRDRNAAYFAEPDGARILLCSEIGSEGRNFQFAHHLVLFDLPDNPELLEQRIGRLDRIGQAHDVEIHVPFLPGTPTDILRRYYHEGLDAFEHNLHGSHEAHEHFHQQILAWCRTPTDDQPALLAQIATYRQQLLTRLEHGRDRLLELNSFRPDVAAQLTEAIADCDFRSEVDDFTLQLLDFFGFTIEDMSNRSYMIRAERLFSDSLPSVPEEGLLATFERRRALSRDDLAFLSWDHPLVLGLLDALLGGPHGNAVFAIAESATHKELILDVRFSIECVAPPALHIDRFLPPTPLSISVDHQLSICEPRTWDKLESVHPGSALLANSAITQTLLPKMIQCAQLEAEPHLARIIDAAKQQANQALAHERDRLLALREVNKSVRQEEVELANQRLHETTRHLSQARLRVDSLRLVWHGPNA